MSEHKRKRQRDRIRTDPYAPVSRRGGRPPAITPDLLPKIEQLAADGLNDATIAAALGIGERTFRSYKNGEVDSPVSAALKAGQLRAIEETAADLKRHAKNNPIAAIYRTKAILGRHDSSWLDQRQMHHTGSMSVAVYDGVNASERQADAIEAEYEEVPPGDGTPPDEG